MQLTEQLDARHIKGAYTKLFTRSSSATLPREPPITEAHYERRNHTQWGRAANLQVCKMLENHRQL